MGCQCSKSDVVEESHMNVEKDESNKQFKLNYARAGNTMNSNIIEAKYYTYAPTSNDASIIEFPKSKSKYTNYNAFDQYENIQDNEEIIEKEKKKDKKEIKIRQLDNTFYSDDDETNKKRKLSNTVVKNINSNLLSTSIFKENNENERFPTESEIKNVRANVNNKIQPIKQKPLLVSNLNGRNKFEEYNKTTGNGGDGATKQSIQEESNVKKLKKTCTEIELQQEKQMNIFVKSNYNTFSNPNIEGKKDERKIDTQSFSIENIEYVKNNNSNKVILKERK